MPIKDNIWLWGHSAGSHNGIYGTPGESRITPVEAAHYLGISNLLSVTYENYGPYPPFEQYALAMQSLDQVVWSIVGASGVTSREERQAVFALAEKFSNITGVMMDDFFNEEGEPAHLTLEELREVRASLQLSSRLLDLWVVHYDYMLERDFRAYLELCDVVTFWTWKASNLQRLEENFAKFTERTPKQRRVLGCYLWDYGNSQPMPLELMKMQCEFGLKRIQSGQIDGIIFLASCICDLGLETVAWTKEWIAANGG
jgi:hypothetical protein